MSFSSEIKEELTALQVKTAAEEAALLAGLTRTCASLRLGRPVKVVYRSESKKVIRLTGKLLQSRYGLAVEAAERKQEHRKNSLYTVVAAGPGCERLLKDAGFLHDRAQEDGRDALLRDIPAPLVDTPACRTAFLRGVFLGCGSCTDPARGYHLELVCSRESFGTALMHLINSFGPGEINSRYVERRTRSVVYLKGQDVPDFLALIGASSGALAVEGTRAERDYRNYINRRNNCETANIGKTVNAALLQLQAIETIEERMPLTRLPAPLYEAARLRLQYPEATLQELADLAEIGKSGMNHRLTRLMKIAEEGMVL